MLKAMVHVFDGITLPPVVVTLTELNVSVSAL